MTYKGNIGFEEMVKFYQVADGEQIERMEKAASFEDAIVARELIHEVLHVELEVN